ncbi:MAG TPA: signal peptidase I [Gammaproteobacteria bacterium]|nr:signal peptidase I [Gammaproteobacteria bacterium]
MGVDFELLLVILTAITGVVWGWDKWRSRGVERQTAEEAAPTGLAWWTDLARSLFPVILAVLVIRSFLFEPFRIPSGSMIPTLFNGDFILVNKFSYGVRLPVLHKEIVNLGRPERGDVIVFRYPLNPAQDYIKRVIGLPGDKIVYRNKQLYVNGDPVRQLDLGRYIGPEQEADALLRREWLGDAVHPIVLHTDSPDRDFSYVVPADSYFVMGDNRDRSSDSRFWGPVPAQNLVGRAFLVWMSWNPDEFGINWKRIGNRIR